MDILYDFNEKACDILKKEDNALKCENIKEESIQNSIKNLSKKEEYVELLKEFYEDEDIIEFIRNEIKTNGIHSMITRRILAHKYDIGLTILGKDFDGTIKIVEQHNYKDFINTSDNLSNFWDPPIESKEIFLLQKREKFSVLNLETEKYLAFLRRQDMESKYKQIFDELARENSQLSVAYLDESKKKFGMTENKFLRIFNDDNFLIDTSTLITVILSYFPRILVKYNETGVENLEFDEKNEKISNIFESQFEVENDKSIRDSIALYLEIIARRDGLPILKAFAIKFSNERNLLKMQEFYIILKSIVELMSERESLRHFLTFLVLGNKQENWPLELLLLKLEKIYGLLDENLKKTWKKDANKIQIKNFFMLFLEKVLETDESKLKLKSEELNEIFDNIKYFEKQDYNNLKNTTLSTWKIMTTERYWKEELEKLKKNQNDEEINFEEVKVIFEELNNKFGAKAKELLKILQGKKQVFRDLKMNEFLKNFKSEKWRLSNETFNILRKKAVKEWMEELINFHFSECIEKRAVKIARIIRDDSETSKNVKESIESIANQVEKIFKLICPKKGKRFMEFEENDLKEWIENFNDQSVLESLAIISRMFQIKKKVTLRDTQLVSILTMWHSEKGVMTQVSTGEGKTLIGASFAILKVLHKEKIDIITSSSVLAIRDSVENREYFKFFGISIGHNCHENTEERKKAYTCDVVYGILGNFQRDYLLTEFFGQNLLSARERTNVLVDEIDSMLLDKGNNILYLSSDIPDIDEIRSIFFAIWECVNQGIQDDIASSLNNEVIRKVILDMAFGLIEENDLKKMDPNINTDKIMQMLRNGNVIDAENLIQKEFYSDEKCDEKLKDLDENIREKIKFFCKSKIERDRKIKIPKYLKKYVLLHLDKWIESALHALVLQNEKEYIVDRRNTGYEFSTEPNIIILDLGTGTDMAYSQWGEGLHQFLQLKHGCKLSQISLKSVFISNVSYFKRYKKLYGMSGTLGSKEERERTTKMNKIDYVTIPRNIEHRFNEYSPILEVDRNKWIERIHSEVAYMIDNKRSVLIICETIKDTKIIQKELVTKSPKIPGKNIYVYQRDNTKFDFEKLNSKHVIISTNLAGRGTDIKLNEELEKAGGLHVILTFLPQNTRIEEQAFGRAARAGDKGSGRLIINTESETNISCLKSTRNKNELERLDDVVAYYENFIQIEEELFKKFHHKYEEVRKYDNKKLIFYSLIRALMFTIDENFEFYIRKASLEINTFFTNLYWQWSDEKSVHLDSWMTVNKHSKNELEWLSDVIEYYKNFNQIEEELFEELQSSYEKLKKAIQSKQDYESVSFKMIIFIESYININKAIDADKLAIFLENFKLQWSFWLDKNSLYLDNWKTSKEKSQVYDSLNNFLTNPPALHPVKRIEIFKLFDKKNEFDKARSFLIKGSNFEEDSVTFQYYKCYTILKEYQEKCNYNHRDLTSVEQKQIMVCMKMLKENIDQREMNIQTISSISQKYQETLVPINGFRNQQQTLNEIDKIFVNSLQSFLGQPVTSDTFETPNLKNDVFLNDLYEELISKDCIVAPKINNLYTNDDIKKVANNHNINFEELSKFIESKKDYSIISMDRFTEEVKQSIQLPSREEFWDILVKEGILTNEVEYAVIDLSTIEKVDPSIHEEINVKITSDKMTTTMKTEIFLSQAYEDERKFVVQLESIKAQMSSERFSFLMENGVIEINKRANFNITKHNQLKNDKIFDKFDEIKVDDFKGITRDHNMIIEKLTKSYEDDRTVLTKRSYNSFRLNYENVDLIEYTSEVDIFGEYPTVREKVVNLIKLKFAYRIALEVLASKINRYMDELNSPVDLSTAIVIHLPLSPHLILMGDLVRYNILDEAKADMTKIENIDKVINSFRERNIGDKLGYRKGTFSNFKTSNFLKKHWEIIAEDKESIEIKLKGLYQAFRSENYDSLDVVLVPIEQCLTRPEQRELLDFMKSKGFDMIMQVNLKYYSFDYWIKFAAAMGIAMAQIALGAAIMVTTTGFGYKVGEFFLNEGIGDTIYILGTLRSGMFRWQDYQTYKKQSVITTAVYSLVSFGAAKFNFIGRSTSFVEKMAMKHKLVSTNTILGLTKQGGAIGNNIAYHAFIEFAKKVGLSAGKAIVQSAVGYGVDKIIENFLDDIVKSVSAEIVDYLMKDFWTHDLSRSIDNMLLCYSPNDTKDLIFKGFTKIVERQDFCTNICDKIIGKIDQLIQSSSLSGSENLILKTSLTLSSYATQAFGMGSAIYFTCTILDSMNKSLLEILEKKDDSDKIKPKLTEDQIKKVKSDILEHIKETTVEKFKNTANSCIVKPALTLIANNIIDGITSYATNYIKNRIKSENEEKYKRTIAQIIENSPGGKVSEPDIEKINKILANTTDIGLYALIYAKLDIPMNSVAVEAASVLIRNELGKSYKIIVEYEGREINFGEVSNPEAEVVIVKLKEGHFENSLSNQLGNDCFYNAIADQIPEFGEKISPKSFRDGLANTMLTDEKIIKEIHDTSKKYLMEANFFGGKEKQTRRAASYNQARHLYGKSIRNFKTINHDPPFRTFSVVYPKISRGQAPAMPILIPIHEELMTTGNYTEAKIFGDLQILFLQNGRPDLAVELGIIDLFSTSSKISSIKNHDTHITELKEEYDRYIDNLHLCKFGKEKITFLSETQAKESKEKLHDPSKRSADLKEFYEKLSESKNLSKSKNDYDKAKRKDLQDECKQLKNKLLAQFSQK